MKRPYSTLSSPLKDRQLAKLGGGLEKGYFYFRQTYFKKLVIKNFESIKFILICYEFIKNNSYINLDYGNHI